MTAPQHQPVSLWKARVLLVALCVLLGSSLLHYSEATELGIGINLFTREVTRDTPGWNVTPPWMLVAKVDLRPERVCVESTGRGALNCKLVQFRPEAYHEFVATEGWSYWWWANRFSFNLSYDNEYRGMRDLLRGYAYSPQKFPFVAVQE